MLSLFFLVLSSATYFVFLLLLSTWVELPTEQMVVLVFLPLIMAWLKYAAGYLRERG